MLIIKFQRSRLTFLPRSLILETLQHVLKNLFFSETFMPIELKFHMKYPYDRLANINTNCSGHMTKMATTPIYDKTL